MKRNSKIILAGGVIVAMLLIILVYETLKSTQVELGKGVNPARGNINSNSSIIEFSDFECPYCRNAVPLIDELVSEYNISLYFRNFPLSFHQYSFGAALASECANEQGKFWEYHDLLFTNENLDVESLKGHARVLGLNEGEFNSCLDSEKYRADIEQDIQEGKAAGVSGTPTFFVNGVKVLGADEEKIRSILSS